MFCLRVWQRVRKQASKTKQNQEGNNSSTNNHQLVLLDHGMYRRLDSEFRTTYCELWKAMIIRDNHLAKASLAKLGMDAKYYEPLSLWFTYRTPTSKKGVGQRLTIEERRALRKKYEKGATREEVNVFLRSMPRDMLYVSRSNNLIRSINRQLGGTSRERLKVFAECAVKGISLPVEQSLTAKNQLSKPNKNLERPEASLNQPVTSELVNVPSIGLFSLGIVKLRVVLWIYDVGFRLMEWVKHP
uniref:ABC1 atypical kinase-like domain-containing protein n=1 Tax=Fibrocapsa japonica TaxID=94617 RepID=A0A7S2V1K6_9STRA